MRHVAALLACVLAAPGVALAHPEVERVRQLVNDGEYDAARPAMEATLARDDLERDDLVALLEARALLFYGLADRESLDRALRSLASIEPTHRFGARYPPDLARRSVEIGAEMSGPLRVDAETVPSAVGVRLEARVENDGEGLVRALRHRVFDATTGEWRAVDSPVEAAAGRELLVFVEAVGPGGAVIATAGSPDDPIRLSAPGAVPVETGPDAPPLGEEGPAPSSGGFPDWAAVVLTVGAVLLVGLVVGGSIYAVENPTITWQPSPPNEEAP